MWPIVLAFGTVALFLAIAGKAKAAKPVGVKAITPSPTPPALPPAVQVVVKPTLPGAPPVVAPPVVAPPVVAPPVAPAAIVPVAPVPTPPTPKPEAVVPGLPPGCTEADRTFVANVITAMAKGSASLDLIRKAHALALRCFPATASAIKGQLDKAVEAARAKAIPDARKQLAAIVTAPDAPPSPIPNDPKTGKSLWFITTRGGLVLAIPRFRPVLNLFKKLQASVGADQDGRIGPETVTKFRNKMTSLGFTKFPTTQAALAANVVKYITVIGQKIPAAQVGHHGARGGSALNAPFPGC